MATALTLDELNRLPLDAFTAALADIYEHSDWIPASVHRLAPFAGVTALAAAMVDAVRRAGRDAQLALLRAHPELAGKAAQAGTLTAHSTDEQRGAGLVNLSKAERQRLADLNAAYQIRFGFPFIIAVKNHDKAGILAEFERRSGNDPETELATCLEQVHHIARFRLDALLG